MGRVYANNLASRVVHGYCYDVFHRNSVCSVWKFDFCLILLDVYIVNKTMSVSSSRIVEFNTEIVNTMRGQNRLTHISSISFSVIFTNINCAPAFNTDLHCSIIWLGSTVWASTFIESDIDSPLPTEVARMIVDFDGSLLTVVSAQAYSQGSVSVCGDTTVLWMDDSAQSLTKRPWTREATKRWTNLF